MTSAYRDHRLTVNQALRAFVDDQLLPDLEIEPLSFWQGFAHIIEELTEENRRLLHRRAVLQSAIDSYHLERAGRRWDAVEYREFLSSKAYLSEPGEPFRLHTRNVDHEIATIAGPQLVVPVSNARFALNAANARWGSLYDALYGSDVIPLAHGRAAGGGPYDPLRGADVIRYAASFLDRAVPLAAGSHRDATEYRVVDDASGHSRLAVTLASGAQTGLADPARFIGHAREGGRTVLLLRNHGLHIELRIDRNHPVGRDAAAGICDIELEAAVTTIQDCEDSVAAVDAEDKVGVYRNWLELMRGTLTATFSKGGRRHDRRLNGDRHYTGANGARITLPGRALMLVRNVGLLMTTDAVRDANGDEVFEGILDAVITVACGLYDLRGLGRFRNSRAGSIYIVKPKLHGPEEAAFCARLFSRVEDLFGLDRCTIKIGVMDEERRTSVNLEECIRAVQDRLAFINTGFLDRTGDEIHTSMLAGPMLPKEQIKEQPWIRAYEDRNVDIGIRCGLPGKAQIGKGMWAKPDEMRKMMESKLAHPAAGANCAWVPSPTAATLHAMHYHAVDVFARQAEIAARPEARLDEVLTPPLCAADSLSRETVQAELDNNAQGILGYVVRWIDQGIGCSKVPDIHGVGLMEDRATLRISSQHIANWLYHGICTEDQVLESLRRMARVVDQQNAGDPAYIDMAPDFDRSLAFQAACDLVLKAREQTNGYTEPLLHEYRRRRKRQMSR